MFQNETGDVWFRVRLQWDAVQDELDGIRLRLTHPGGAVSGPKSALTRPGSISDLEPPSLGVSSDFGDVASTQRASANANTEG